MLKTAAAWIFVNISLPDVTSFYRVKVFVNLVMAADIDSTMNVAKII